MTLKAFYLFATSLCLSSLLFSCNRNSKMVNYWLNRPNHLEPEMLQMERVTQRDMEQLGEWDEAGLSRYYIILSNDSIIDFFRPFPMGWPGSGLRFKKDSIFHGSASYRDFSTAWNRGTWTYYQSNQELHSEVRIAFNTYRPIVLALTDSVLILKGEADGYPGYDGKPTSPTAVATIFVYKKYTPKEN